MDTLCLGKNPFEEDVGKLIHDGTRSLVDWNRGGTPLIEQGSARHTQRCAAAEWFRMMHRRRKPALQKVTCKKVTFVVMPMYPLPKRQPLAPVWS